MSIFGTIMSKVFGSHHPAATPPAEGGAAPEAAPPTAPASPTPPPDAPAPTSSSAAPTPAPSDPAPAPSAPAPAAAPAAAVDVAAVLDGMESHAGQKLDWRHSIVDLMKLLGLDSSLTARKELAHELNYTGDTSDSASMNIWLHKQVMTKFAENGGKLPPDIHS